MGYYLNEKEFFAIENHYNKYFTKLGAKHSGKIFHDLLNDGMHIDYTYYEATEDFPFQILATIGMSAYTMKDARYSNIELVMFLPKYWEITNTEDPNWYWPFKLLKIAARLPYFDKTILSYGHRISYDANNTPFADSTEMCAGLVVFPELLDYSFFALKTGSIFSKKTTNFLCLTAINENELKIIQEMGEFDFIDKVLKKSGTLDLIVRNKRNP